MSCDCAISVELIPGNDCGIEFTDGVAYAIGDQDVDFTLSDPCDCVTDVFINGETPPTAVEDGEVITVSISAPNCYLCGDSVECQGAFSPFRGVGPSILGVWRKDGKVRLMLNPRKVREAIAHRRQVLIQKTLRGTGF